MSRTIKSKERWYTNTKPDALQGLVTSEADGRNIAVTYDPEDAALVAAAPEMLACLELAIEEVEGFQHRTGVHQFAGWIIKTRDAIRKAKGE